MTPLQTYALANPVVDVPPVQQIGPYAQVQYDAGVVVRALIVEQPEGVDVPRWHAMSAIGVRGAVRGRAKRLRGLPSAEKERMKRLCLELLDGVGAGEITVTMTPTEWHARRVITGAEQNVLPIGWLVARADRAS